MSRRHTDESVQGDMVAHHIARFSPAWRRQISGKDSSYESPRLNDSIWVDRVSKMDRQPEMLAGRDMNKHKRDLFGNRLKSDTAEQKVRAGLQRFSAIDKDFACVWRSMTPAQVNGLVEKLARL